MRDQVSRKETEIVGAPFGDLANIEGGGLLCPFVGHIEGKSDLGTPRQNPHQINVSEIPTISYNAPRNVLYIFYLVQKLSAWLSSTIFVAKIWLCLQFSRSYPVLKPLHVYSFLSGRSWQDCAATNQGPQSPARTDIKATRQVVPMPSSTWYKLINTCLN